MKNFRDWGVKMRCLLGNNYKALWFNLKTIRLGEGRATELPPNLSEFYDIGINTLCNAGCDFCYVSAGGKGINYPDICETWKKWMDTFEEHEENGVTMTTKPFQIAIGE